MVEIALQGVTKNWGTAQAVKVIDFHVRSGSFVVLLGPSGCAAGQLGVKFHMSAWV
jgi:ABC-type sugar transport system ATPase subunit